MTTPEQDIKELRQSIESLREKLSKDVIEAFTSSRDLHQKQALLMAKIEVRVEAIESHGKQLLMILQGDGVSPGLVGTVDLLRSKIQDLAESSRALDLRITKLDAEVASCKSNASLLPVHKDEIEQLKKEVLALKTREAQVQGGWYVGGAIFAAIMSLLAMVGSLWQNFH